MIEAAQITIRHVEARCLRIPIAVPVRTSFGVMHDRPAVFVHVTDDAGYSGVGEVWCNFPTVAAEHRVNLAQKVVGPLLVELGPLAVGSVFARLMERLHVLALQSGEWGPLNQVAAGLDAACHTLAATRANLPLWRFLAPFAKPLIRAYASGIGPESPAETAAAAAAAGHRAFKLKVGFGRDRDLAALDAIRGAIGSEAALMIDANQGWTAEEATLRCPEYAAYDISWVEEPIRADRPAAEWATVAAASPVPLAGGENVVGDEAFDAVIRGEAMHFIQPDVAKWGGVSGCLAVAERARAAGGCYCPHFLGAGVGLVTSAHLLAAAGGAGLLEVDVNPNPLRDHLAAPLLVLENGWIELSDRIGIGIDWPATGLKDWELS